MTDDDKVIDFASIKDKLKTANTNSTLENTLIEYNESVTRDIEFNDRLIESIQNYIFEEGLRHGYDIHHEDTRFIQDVTIACNILRSTLDRLAGIANELTDTIDEIATENAMSIEQFQASLEDPDNDNV